MYLYVFSRFGPALGLMTASREAGVLNSPRSTAFPETEGAVFIQKIAAADHYRPIMIQGRGFCTTMDVDIAVIQICLFARLRATRLNGCCAPDAVSSRSAPGRLQLSGCCAATAPVQLQAGYS